MEWGGRRSDEQTEGKGVQVLSVGGAQCALAARVAGARKQDGGW